MYDIGGVRHLCIIYEVKYKNTITVSEVYIGTFKEIVNTLFDGTIELHITINK